MKKKPKSLEAAAESDRSVLIVDNDAMLRRTLAAVLVARGWKVATQPDGLRALQYLEDNCVDVVIADERMHGPAGPVLLETVHKLCPGTRLVLLSGWPSRVSRERVAALGGVSVVKGDTKELLDALDA
jgi:ActR/RegA family two-component response regulator